MNKLFIVGNLTRDPELRTTQSGISVCSFTVAVNRRRASQDQSQPQADFFRVTAWRALGENCAKYLAKGRKVSVVGSVAVSTYQAQDGSTRAQLEVTADDVEFLTPKSEQPGQYNPAGTGIDWSQYATPPQPPVQAPTPSSQQYVEVDEDELPF